MHNNFSLSSYLNMEILAYINILETVITQPEIEG